MDLPVMAEQLTSVRPSTFLHLETSNCQNIWRRLARPQRALMCAASSCVSVGWRPIRSELERLVLQPNGAGQWTL